MPSVLENPEFWQLPASQVLNKLETQASGLNELEAHQRLKKYGPNIIHQKTTNLLAILIRQFTTNPLILILGVATFISYLLGQHVSSYYIFGMIVLSISLGLFNEYSAERTINNLLKKISPTALIIRNNQKLEVLVSDLVIGDIVLLSPGSIVPAELRLIETKDLEVNQAPLTGESQTVYKNSLPILKKSQSTADLINIAFMGTSVESGIAKGVVIATAQDTEFGKIAQSTTYLKPATEFQKGLARFGQLIIKVIIVLTVAIFAVNSFLGHELIQSLLFALAIAVGLTPELLPVIVTVSLSHGAGKLAKKHVVVKKLISIENLGNMDILCTDKTGTLTEGQINVVDFIDENGKSNIEVLKMATIANSAIVHHKVIGSGIDTAIWQYTIKNHVNLDESVKKVDEEPFDYNRRFMYTVISQNKENLLIAKGTPEKIMSLCKNIKNKKEINGKFLSLSKDGLRTIALATKKISKKKSYSWNDAQNLDFTGYITFLDVAKETTKEDLDKLQNLNVAIKIITGDNEFVTQKICRDVGMKVEGILLGNEIDKCSEEKFSSLVQKTTIFARVSPSQKVRIIQSLQKLGHTVGYLGDGINDIPSLHSADVGISVNSAIDVAKDAATIVLLRKSLNAVIDGIIDGRRVFKNTMKYILMSTSSNFGNMFSAAGASFILPFLPMTPLQILLTNSLYDISQMSIPTDNIDRESLIKPRHWNINFIRNYMIFFGPLSSIFDFATFGIMIFIFHAQGPLFQTGWFIESLATEILVIFVIRTAKTPFFTSRPSNWLAATCLIVVALGVILPFTRLAKPFGFITPPPAYFALLIVLVIAYLGLVEAVKSIFLKKYLL